MLKIAVLAVLVGVAAAAEPCCSPDQWEGGSILISGADKDGMPSKTEVTSMISYDFTNMLLTRTIEFTDGSVTVKNRTIFNYNTKMMFNYDMNTFACTMMMFDQPFDKACTPANGKPAGDFSYGFPSDMLMGSSMSFTDGMTSGIYVYTVKDCIPLSEIVYGQMNTVNFITTEEFINITPGIKDPSVFTPPSTCPMSIDEKTKVAKLRRGGLGFPRI